MWATMALPMPPLAPVRTIVPLGGMALGGVYGLVSLEILVERA